jgi:uncharacterized membrane protein (DUF485 family)
MSEHAKIEGDAIELKRVRIGVRMTVLYSLVYAGFVGLSVFQPTWMGANAVFGLNLAVAYGLGLIIIAIVFALVYNRLCRTMVSDAGPPGS